MEEAEVKYVTQLKEVFDSCDTTGNGCLNEVELHDLCEKLHLLEHEHFLVHQLLENETEVKFEDFKECFVAVLTESIPSEESESSKNDDSADREVSPKFTFGRKKYGRRSRPASIADDNSSVTASPILSPQSSIEQSPVFTDRSSKVLCGGESFPGKRPRSPNGAQQPPTKSGRMTTHERISGREEVTSLQQISDSDTDINHSFENNPVNYLQETWKKLGIGQNGYLNVEELALVCDHIGMDMTDEVIAQLFEKLDCDQDGQISFDEFLQGLFQHGEPESLDSLVLKSETSKSIFNDGTRDDHQISNTCISGIFSCIDASNTGYADASTILELWESLELPCSPQLLEELGFNTMMKINLADLTTVLEEVIMSVLGRPLLQLAFVSYQNELHFLRQTIDQMRSERNKLKVNVEEANTRAALLAQEVDDNHAKLENSLQKKLLLMEKKYQEQARELVEELQQERDSFNSQTNKLKQQLQKDLACMREEEAKLKSRLNLIQQENNRLEQELVEASERFIEAEKLNEVLQKELLMMPGLKEKLAQFESQEMQDRHHQSLLDELGKCKETNQELQDKIDELTLEMENMHQNTIAETASAKEVSRTHSWLSDYRRGSIAGYKRRGSDSSSDENSEDENPTMGKIRKSLFPDAKLSKEGDVQDVQNGGCKAVPFKVKQQPYSVDILLRDMIVDHSQLMKKLQLAEEKGIKMEKAYRQAENRNKILGSLLREMSGAVTA